MQGRLRHIVEAASSVVHERVEQQVVAVAADGVTIGLHLGHVARACAV